MNTKTAHTPTPCNNLMHATPCDMFCDGCIADCWEENAAFIVRAVNCHKELLDTLRSLTEQIHLSKLNIRKDFSLINAHAYALKAIYKAEAL